MKVNEEQIWKLWENIILKAPIKVQNNLIEILDIGELSELLAGPDFKLSKIKINGEIFIGDVEIDVSQKNWYYHGHSSNKNFNSVILHVHYDEKNVDPYVYCESGKSILSVSLFKITPNAQAENLIQNEGIKCSGKNNAVSDELKLKFIRDLGAKRLKHKIKKLFLRLKEVKFRKELSLKEPVHRYNFDKDFYDEKISREEYNTPYIWRQTFYESVFESLGFTQNKEKMAELASLADLEFLEKYFKKYNSIEALEAILFSLAGLTPSVVDLPVKGHFIPQW